MQSDAEERLWRFVDRAEIGELLSAYAHATDRRDAATVRACFHEGATFQHLDNTPVPAAAMFTPQLYERSGLLVTGHYLTNMLVEFDGPDCASCQTSVMAYHLVAANFSDSAPPFVSRGEEYGVVIGARYFDRVERGPAGWRFRSRALTFDWSYEVEASPLSKAMFGVLNPPGRRIAEQGDATAPPGRGPTVGLSPPTGGLDRSSTVQGD